MVKFRWLIILLIFMIPGCKSGSESPPSTEKSLTEQIIPVKTVLVQDTTILETVRVTGEIQSLAQVDIFPQANGLIVKKFVRQGESVTNNQVLAEFVQDIPGMKFAPIKIKATTDGVITMDAIENGTRISVQRAVYTISIFKQVYFKAQLSESFLSQIKLGTQVKVNIEAFPEKLFPGKIMEISPTVNPVSRTATLKILINNPLRQLKPGMSGQAGLTTERHPGLVIPIDAILHSGANQYVYRIQQNIAYPVPVRTGIFMDHFVEIIEGLVAGESVVVFGQNLLSPGSRVTVIEN